MSSIGIWCMHFIGNRAIVIGDGDERLQLVYNPNYTGLSFVLPFIGLSIAFSCAEFRPRKVLCCDAANRVGHWFALSVTGILAGLSIVGMHYVGNFGVTNYQLHYEPRFLAASIVIAVGDSWAVLMLFYSWRDKWISHWWKRLLCATLLAGGVSAMHFTAATKCIYEFKHFNSPGAIADRNANVIAAGVCCGTAVACSFVVLWYTRHSHQKHRNRSKKVTVACFMFDPEGRILVYPEGTVPCRTIAEQYRHRSFDDDFDTAHPVFHWIFRVSHNWHSVAELVPAMRSHYNATKEVVDRGFAHSSTRSSALYSSHATNSFGVLFRESFCMAVATMASSLHLPLDKMGVLYDQVVETAITDLSHSSTHRFAMSSKRSLNSSHHASSLPPLRKGQLLILVRQLSAGETDSLLNGGLRLAQVPSVNRSLAEQLQIPIELLDEHMANLKAYLDTYSGDRRESGTFLSLFALIPKAHARCFDVVVKRSAANELPDAMLLSKIPLPWQIQWLRRMDGMTLMRCVDFLENEGNRVDDIRSVSERNLACAMLLAINKLGDMVSSEWLLRAKFCGTPQQAHYASRAADGKRQPTVLYAFTVIQDLHTTIRPNKPILTIPVDFLKIRHMCYEGSPNHEMFTRYVQEEFAPLLVNTLGHQHYSLKNKLSDVFAAVKGMGPGTFQMQQLASQPESLASSHPISTPTPLATPINPFQRRLGSLSATSNTISEPATPAPLSGIMINQQTTFRSESNSDLSLRGIHIRAGRLHGHVETEVCSVLPETTFVETLLGVACKGFTHGHASLY